MAHTHPLYCSTPHKRHRVACPFTMQQTGLMWFLFETLCWLVHGLINTLLTLVLHGGGYVLLVTNWKHSLGFKRADSEFLHWNDIFLFCFYQLWWESCWDVQMQYFHLDLEKCNLFSAILLSRVISDISLCACIYSSTSSASETLCPSNSIKTHNFSSRGSGKGNAFSCFFIAPMYLIFTYRLSISQRVYV